ncbi:MAG: cysteine synthase family protein [Acidobacteria bacterium]|nr:cysteine synthase family protein [Acidobacteriota bacterium]
MVVGRSILEAIGHTPVVRLRHLVDARCADVLVKLEWFNPTGSYKDRMALAMIEGAEKRGVLKPGMRVVEFTGGSTGSSLAMICAIKGYRFVPVSNDAIAAEKLNTMRAFGADLIVLKSDGGKLTPDLFDRMRAEVDRLRAEPGTFWTDQFNNTDALDGYMNIGRELFEQAGGTLHAFCGGVGTGGMLAGVSRALKKVGSAARIVALEPASSPFMTKGHGGPHRVEGIGAFPTLPHLAPGVYDEARAIDENEARAMARELAKKEGILAGTSSALNVVAAIQLARELGPGKVVATVAVDTGLKYLAGDLFGN